MRIEGIVEEEDITRREVGDHQIGKTTRVENIQEEGDPLMMEDPWMMEGPLMMENCLMMEDPQEMEGHQEDLEDKDHQAHQDLPGPVCPIIVQQTQVTLDTTTLENTFGTVGQSMLQLARAQDQANRYLQEHLQQGQMNMQAHTGALQQLTTSTYQRNFGHIFASIPIYDGSNREGFFPWLECLEATCFYSGRNIKIEALRRLAGPVQNIIMALLNAHSWKAIREELKRCFSDQTSLGHAAIQLENMTQKPNEP